MIAVVLYLIATHFSSVQSISSHVTLEISMHFISILSEIVLSFHFVQGTPISDYVQMRITMKYYRYVRIIKFAPRLPFNY